MQAKAANSQGSDVRQQGYLKAALQGALDKATPVQPSPWSAHHHRPAVKGMIAVYCSVVCDCAIEPSLHSMRPSLISRLSSQNTASATRHMACMIETRPGLNAERHINSSTV